MDCKKNLDCKKIWISKNCTIFDKCLYSTALNCTELSPQIHQSRTTTYHGQSPVAWLLDTAMKNFELYMPWLVQGQKLWFFQIEAQQKAGCFPLLRGKISLIRCLAIFCNFERQHVLAPEHIQVLIWEEKYNPVQYNPWLPNFNNFINRNLLENLCFKEYTPEANWKSSSAS